VNQGVRLSLLSLFFGADFTDYTDCHHARRGSGFPYCLRPVSILSTVPITCTAKSTALCHTSKVSCANFIYFHARSMRDFGEQAMFFESIGIKEAYASYWRLGDWFLFWVVQILFKQLTIFWHGFHGLRCFWFGKKVNVMVVLEFHSYGKRAGSCLLSKTACNTISDSSIV